MGLKEEALTFKRFPPGDRGVLGPFCVAIDEVRMGAGVGAAAAVVDLPLNGGIAWMNMLILFEPSFVADAPDDVFVRAAGLLPLTLGCGEPDAGSLAVAGALER